MDSITQFSLGAAIGIAVSPKKTPKIAIISGLLASLPDLDILLTMINDSNDLDSTINHRGASHSLFFLTLVSPLLALILFKFFNYIDYFRWWLITFLALTTHAILDSFTIYGTSLFLPFSDEKIMIGSIFIVDPIYTLPLLVSFIYLMVRKKPWLIKGKSFNTMALVFSHIYLLFGVIVQQIIVPTGHAFATPTPFNSYLWRVVKVEEGNISEYFVDIFGDQKTAISVKNQQSLREINLKSVNKYAKFSSNFYNLEVDNNQLILQDLRMGNIKNPVFSFVIAKKIDNKWKQVEPRRHTIKIDINAMFGG